MIDAILRQDFYAFVRKTFALLNPGREFLPNWHLEAIAHKLELCVAGKLQRLLITINPRSLKSLITSIAFPAFLLGHDPTQRIIVVSYGGDLAQKLSRDFRKVVESEYYQRIFPGVIASKSTEVEFETSQGGFRLGTSVGGTLTGRGANVIIIDDPLKADDAAAKPAREAVNDFYRTTLLSRLDDKTKGIIIVVMQRLHDEDLAGQLVRSGGFDTLNLPAIAVADEHIALLNGRTHQRSIGDVLHPAREDRAALEAMKAAMGSLAFQAQYQQMPVPDGGNLIQKDWIRYCDFPPQRLPGDKVVQSWDTAMKGEQHNDYSVCSTWHVRGADLYLIDLFRAHLDYPSLVRAAVAQNAKHKPNTVLIEDQGSGIALIQDLRNSHGLAAIPIKADRDKQIRLSTVSPMFEAGQVYLIRNASWVAALLDELLRFPQTKFDDQVDSVSQFLNWQRNNDKSHFEVFWT